MKPDIAINQGQRGTIIHGEYGVSFVGTPDRPRAERDHEAERRADRMTRKEAAARFFKSEKDFDFAASHKGFPQRLALRARPYGGGHESIYSASAIAEWCAEQRTIVASFK